MEHVRSVVVAGGDLRQIYGANALAQKGCTVTAIGFDQNPLFEGVLQSDDPNVIADAELLLLPLGISKGELLNTPLYSGEIRLEDCLKQLSKDGALFGGNVTVEERELAGKYSLAFRDYFKAEELTVANALLTAEAAIQLAMEQLPISLWNCPCLICGGGRIAMLLGERLHALGAKVTLAARKAEQRIWAQCRGMRAVDFSQLPLLLSEMEVIFNTVPSQWLDQRLLSRTKEDCLLMELASKPYGIDFEGAKQLKRRTLLAAALPGKHSPKTAGELIADTVLRLYGRE